MEGAHEWLKLTCFLNLHLSQSYISQLHGNGHKKTINEDASFREK